jgi:predicted phage terminase large subunit-like protein
MHAPPKHASRADFARELARASPAGFAYVASGGLDPSRGGMAWIPAEHLILISEAICRVVARIQATVRAIERGELPDDTQGPRLMVYMPPRHGKSELISKYTPAWFLGTNPDLRMILASYGLSLAKRWGRKARDLLEDPAIGAELFDVGVSQKSGAADEWDLEGREGGLVAAGVRGAITGKGAHLFVVDDPVKDAADAASETMQDNNWDWWQGTARTRLMPGAGVIVLQTRWHELDLSGKLLANDPTRDQDGRKLPEGERRDDVDGEEWEVLCIPAVADDEGDYYNRGGDPLDRAPGEALWPAFYGPGALRSIEKAVGRYVWAALYQQRPQPAEGGVFRRADFRYFRHDDEHDLYVLLDERNQPLKKVGGAWLYRFATCDPATSEKQTADYSVLAHWGVTPDGELLLLDIERHKFEAPGLEDFMLRTVTAWDVWDVRVEAKAAGQALVQRLRTVHGWPVRELEADTDKVTRAMGAVPRYEAHMVHHRLGAPWLGAYERELLGFPTAAHDDQVDVFSYASLAVPKIMLARRQAQKETGKTHTGGLLGKRL